MAMARSTYKWEVTKLFNKKKSPKHKFVIHLNHKKNDNSAKNLKWATHGKVSDHQQNSPQKIVYKNDRPTVLVGLKLTATQVKTIKDMINNPKRKTCNKWQWEKYGVSEMTLYRIKVVRTGQNKIISIASKTVHPVEESNGIFYRGFLYPWIKIPVRGLFAEIAVSKFRLWSSHLFLSFKRPFKGTTTNHGSMHIEKEYENAKTAFHDSLTKVIKGIVGFDKPIGLLQAKDCTFRINRDVRFSKIKTLIKIIWVGILIKTAKKAGAQDITCIVQPGETIAGGIWCLNPM